jgi:hypothetical protein
MATKVTAATVLQWAEVVMQLVALGATTVARVRSACVDAGWAADDARLVALQSEYDRRIARRKAEAGS